MSKRVRKFFTMFSNGFGYISCRKTEQDKDKKGE
jgi:hypothetical protein